MNPKNLHSGRNFWHICTILPGDYKDYGGLVEKGRAFGKAYNDCSCGCKWFIQLYAGNDSTCAYDLDWGVCVNAKSHRAGLLTFEHQAGFGCHEYDTKNKKQAVKIVATGRPRKSMTKLVNDLTDELQEHFWKLFAYSSYRPTSINEWLETLNQYLPKLRIYNVPKVVKTTNVSKEYLQDAWVDTMFGNPEDIRVLISNWMEEGFPKITVDKEQHEKLKKLVEKYIDLIFSEGKLSITDVDFLKSNKTYFCAKEGL